MRRLIPTVGLAIITLLAPAGTFAHNAGHLWLPNGECHEVGSFREAPLVGPDRTSLDLVPATPTEPYDEYGVSFVGYWGNTPIYPGPCR